MNPNLKFMRDFIRAMPECYSIKFINKLDISEFDRNILLKLDILKITQKVLAYETGMVSEKTVVRWHLKALGMSYDAFKRFIYKQLDLSEE